MYRRNPHLNMPWGSSPGRTLWQKGARERTHHGLAPGRHMHKPSDTPRYLSCSRLSAALLSKSKVIMHLGSSGFIGEGGAKQLQGPRSCLHGLPLVPARRVPRLAPHHELCPSHANKLVHVLLHGCKGSRCSSKGKASCGIGTVAPNQDVAPTPAGASVPAVRRPALRGPACTGMPVLARHACFRSLLLHSLMQPYITVMNACRCFAHSFPPPSVGTGRTRGNVETRPASGPRTTMCQGSMDSMAYIFSKNWSSNSTSRINVMRKVLEAVRRYLRASPRSSLSGCRTVHGTMSERAPSVWLRPHSSTVISWLGYTILTSADCGSS